ncbi:MAG: hypothetical protein EXR99_02540 [Gemmataceae bacterium]|nr:hypothetical protein [Gemmataceae bacterium]
MARGFIWLFTLGFTASQTICQAQEGNPFQVSQVNPQVFSSQEKNQFEDMIGKDIRALRKGANLFNSTEWQKINSQAQWEKFRNVRLMGLAQSLGEFPEPPQNPTRKITGTLKGDGFLIENLVFESRSGVWVTGNLYKPEKPKDKMPGILIVHAHHTSKEHGELQDMGMTWARAGCLVLVIDQFGHGERRLHPFADPASFSKPFRLGRQDYYFRFDAGIQLHLLGDSLMGWMVWDIHRSVDLLLAQKGIDTEKIILLGSVAGGGDPAAVAAALDKRIQCVAPFNFGGPQPETRFPLPADAETSFNYAGSGSWEPTRNLARSNRDGFLPWVLIGSIAPRKLIYSHEFQWDQERDPVWKRLKTIYGFYNAEGSLDFTLGKGNLTGNSPTDSHCTHIGSIHRVRIHQALERWFGIVVKPGEEYSRRLPAKSLHCWTPQALKEIAPGHPLEALKKLADQRIEAAKIAMNSQPAPERKKWVQDQWRNILDLNSPVKDPQVIRNEPGKNGRLTYSSVILLQERDLVVPLLFFQGDGEKKLEKPLVVFVSQDGKKGLLQRRSEEIESLLSAGFSVCLPDLRGTGETALGNSRGRNSTATAYSSSLLMEGLPLVGGQTRDLLAILGWLRKTHGPGNRPIYLVSDSPAQINSYSLPQILPRDDDSALPALAEPGTQLAVLAAALFDGKVAGVQVRKGVAGFRPVLDHFLVAIPHASVVPGILPAGDIDLLALALFPMPVQFTQPVNGGNRLFSHHGLALQFPQSKGAYGTRDGGKDLSLKVEEIHLQDWLKSLVKN